VPHVKRIAKAVVQVFELSGVIPKGADSRTIELLNVATVRNMPPVNGTVSPVYQDKERRAWQVSIR